MMLGVDPAVNAPLVAPASAPAVVCVALTAVAPVTVYVARVAFAPPVFAVKAKLVPSLATVKLAEAYDAWFLISATTLSMSAVLLMLPAVLPVASTAKLRVVPAKAKSTVLAPGVIASTAASSAE